ncbi:hypothetical protein HK096_006773 [Nowakowskiella sp. JEL0078]|nr:hypothetical protein HK096_006773 [Nowakowskiella sp. JEL0078]
MSISLNSITLNSFTLRKFAPWILFITVAPSVIKFVAKIVRDQYYRTSDEPPLISGRLPYIGVAFDYIGNQRKYVKALQQKYGDIFTIYIGGNRITYIMDPGTFPVVFRSSKNDISFDPFLETVYTHGFLLPRSDITPEFMSSSHKLYPTYLVNGTAARNISLSFHSHLILAIKSKFAGKEDVSAIGSVSSFFERIFFSASVPALFGGGIIPDEIFDDFKIFDKFSDLILGGVPNIVLSKPRKAQKKIVKHMLERMHGSNSKENLNSISDLLKNREDLMQTQGWSELSRTYMEFSFLWGSQTNIMKIAMNTLTNILSNELALRLVKEEVAALNTNDIPTPEMTPVIDACISDTLRITLDSVSVRKVIRDHEITVKSVSKTFRLRKDDTIVAFLTAAHMNPDFYEGNVEKFDHRHFLKQDKDGKNVSITGGKVVNSFLPFGGGVTICPGRTLRDLHT